MALSLEGSAVAYRLVRPMPAKPIKPSETLLPKNSADSTMLMWALGTVRLPTVTPPMYEEPTAN